MPILTRSNTLEITNNIRQSILNYIRNSQIHDVPELYEDVKNELYYLINNVTRYNIHDIMAILSMLANEFNQRRGENRVDINYPTLISIEIMYHANVEWNNKICSICYDKLKKYNILKTECGHVYCVDCISQYISNVHQQYVTTQKKISCPYCRGKVDTFYTNTLANFNTIKNKCTL